MKKIPFLIFLSLNFLIQSSIAQPYFKRSDSIPVKINGNFIKNPWAGGLNFIQASVIDLNMDGIKDLFIFDRTGNKIRTFINHGTPNNVDYKYAPEYEQLFPHIHDWALLVDFNCDNKEDIFSYSDIGGGFDIYKNTSTVSGGLSFQKIVTQQKSVYNPDSGPPFNTPYNLYVSAVDIPAISDIDNDGDMDVITFTNNGTGVEYHQNQSEELGFNCDSLIFRVRNRCWGFAQETPGGNVFQLHDTCSNNVLNPGMPELQQENKSVDRHSGNCELCIDLDGDADKELIVGGVLFNNLTMLTNGGSPTSANFIANDNAFPSNTNSTTPVNLTLFPCAFYLDVNNDGAKDLLVSPNSPNASEDFNSVLYYKNIGTNLAPNFQFQQYNFLQDNIIDVGEGAYPVFFDYDNDGLQDLFVSNTSYFDTLHPKSKIAQFHNIGTASQPQFQLITRDYDGFDNTGMPLSKIILSINSATSPPDTIYMQNMIPAFGDMDGDADADMIIGNTDGKLIYFENTAAAGAMAHFTLSQIGLKNTHNSTIDVGDIAAPQIYDFDADGKNDLVIGARNGKLTYLHHSGSATSALPSLDSITNYFGQVNVRQNSSVYGYSHPCFFKYNGITKLLIGEEAGFIRLYDSIDANLLGQFHWVDSTFQNISEGTRTAPNVADINNDGYKDLIIGNYEGGVIYFNGVSSLISVNDINANLNWNFTVFPNPANNSITIKMNNSVNSNYSIEIYNTMGQLIKKEKTEAAPFLLNTQNFGSGIYICKVTELAVNGKLKTGTLVKKIVIGH